MSLLRFNQQLVPVNIVHALVRSAPWCRHVCFDDGWLELAARAWTTKIFYGQPNQVLWLPQGQLDIKVNFEPWASTSSYRIQLSYNLRSYHPDYWYVLMCSNSSLLLTWILRTHISFLIHTVNSLSVWLKLRCWTCPRSLPTGIPLLWSLAMEQDINN